MTNINNNKVSSWKVLFLIVFGVFVVSNFILLHQVLTQKPGKDLVLINTKLDRISQELEVSNDLDKINATVREIDALKTNAIKIFVEKYGRAAYGATIQPNLKQMARLTDLVDKIIQDAKTGFKNLDNSK